MNDYENDTEHEATQHFFLDRMDELIKVKTEHSATIQTLSSICTDLFETKAKLRCTTQELDLVSTELLVKSLKLRRVRLHIQNSELKNEEILASKQELHEEILETKQELIDLKERVRRANTLVRQLAILTTNFGTAGSSPYF